MSWFVPLFLVIVNLKLVRILNSEGFRLEG
jgi:hypothetical protein